MSDHNSFTAATDDSTIPIDANQSSGDGYDCGDGRINAVEVLPSNADRIGPSGGDASLVNSNSNSFRDNCDNRHSDNSDDKNISESMRTPGFDPLPEEEMMALMNEYPGAGDKSLTNDVNANDNTGFEDSYSGDTETRTLNSNLHGISGGNDTLASQTAAGDGDPGIYPGYDDRGSFCNLGNALRIDSSFSREEAAPSWLGAVKDAATKTSTPTTSKITNDNGGRHEDEVKISNENTNALEKEEQEPQGSAQRHQELEKEQEQQAIASSESNEIMQEISAKLDEKLNNTRLLVKTLLQEMTIYVQSLETVANEYGRIRESELHESQRLDTVEPEVNGASGMLLASPGVGVGVSAGDCAGANDSNGGGGFYAASDPSAQQPPLSSSGVGHRYKRHSSPKMQVRSVRSRRERPLTPIVGNRRHSQNDRHGHTGKENFDSIRRSFA